MRALKSQPAPRKESLTVLTPDLTSVIQAPPTRSGRVP